jgi:hypothetical protein
MLAMGRALMAEPAVLLLDEPSAGLAPAFIDATFQKVQECRNRRYDRARPRRRLSKSAHRRAGQRDRRGRRRGADPPSGPRQPDAGGPRERRGRRGRRRLRGPRRRGARARHRPTRGRRSGGRRAAWPPDLRASGLRKLPSPRRRRHEQQHRPGSRPRPGGASEAAIRRSIVAPDAAIAEGFTAGVMPGDYARRLSGRQLDALVEHLARTAR